MVVGERGDGHRRAEQQVVPGEPLRPAGAYTRTLLLRAQPSAVRARHRVAHLVGQARRDRREDHPREQRVLLVEGDRRVRVVDPRAGVGERVGGGAQQRAVLRVDGARGVVEPGADAQAGQRREVGLRQVEVPRDRALGFRPGEYTEQQIEIARAAGDGPEHVDVGVGGTAAHVVEVAALRDHAEARLEAEHAAAVRRDAHGAADVGAHLEAGEPCCDRRRRATRRPARGAGDVPWVVGLAEEIVEGLEVTRPTRHVRLAEHDRPRRLQARHRGRVGGGYVVGQFGRTAGGADPLDLDRVLDRDRQPVERAHRVAPGERGVGRVGEHPGPLDVERHRRIDRRVQALDPGEIPVEQLPARHLLVAHRGSETVGRGEQQFVVGHPRILPVLALLRAAMGAPKSAKTSRHVT